MSWAPRHYAGGPLLRLAQVQAFAGEPRRRWEALEVGGPEEAPLVEAGYDLAAPLLDASGLGESERRDLAALLRLSSEQRDARGLGAREAELLSRCLRVTAPGLDLDEAVRVVVLELASGEELGRLEVKRDRLRLDLERFARALAQAEALRGVRLRVSYSGGQGRLGFHLDYGPALGRGAHPQLPAQLRLRAAELAAEAGVPQLGEAARYAEEVAAELRRAFRLEVLGVVREGSGRDLLRVTVAGCPAELVGPALERAAQVHPAAWLDLSPLAKGASGRGAQFRLLGGRHKSWSREAPHLRKTLALGSPLEASPLSAEDLAPYRERIEEEARRAAEEAEAAAAAREAAAERRAKDLAARQARGESFGREENTARARAFLEGLGVPEAMRQLGLEPAGVPGRKTACPWSGKARRFQTRPEGRGWVLRGSHARLRPGGEDAGGDVVTLVAYALAVAGELVDPYDSRAAMVVSLEWARRQLGLPSYAEDRPPEAPRPQRSLSAETKHPLWTPPSAPQKTPDLEAERLRRAALRAGGSVVLDRRATGDGKTYRAHATLAELVAEDGCKRAVAVGSHEDDEKHAAGLRAHAAQLAPAKRRAAGQARARAASIRGRGARAQRLALVPCGRASASGPRHRARLERRQRLSAKRLRSRVEARALPLAEELERRAAELERQAERLDRLRVGILPAFACPLPEPQAEAAHRSYDKATRAGWNPVRAACGGCDKWETCSHQQERKEAAAADLVVIQHAHLAHAAPWAGTLADAVAVAIDEDPKGFLMRPVSFGGPRLEGFARLLEVAGESRKDRRGKVAERLDEALAEVVNPPPLPPSKRQLALELKGLPKAGPEEEERRAKRAAKGRERTARKAWDQEAETAQALEAARQVVELLRAEQVSKDAAQALLAPSGVDVAALLGGGADRAEAACQEVWGQVQAELGREVGNLWPVLRALARSWRDRGFAVLQRRATSDGNAWTFSVVVAAEIPERLGVLTLDATGQPGLLRRLTGRVPEVIEAPPRVELRGLVLADAARGRRRYLERGGALSERGRGKLAEDLDVVARWLKRVEARRVGVVTFKDLVEPLEAGLLGRLPALELRSLYYGGGSRGSNAFEGWADAVVVLGTPYVAEESVRDLAAVLGARPEELAAKRSFELRQTAEGVTFKALVWPPGPLSEAAAMLTSAEQVQALGRSTRREWTPPCGVLVLGQPPETPHPLRVTTPEREALRGKAADLAATWGEGLCDPAGLPPGQLLERLEEAAAAGEVTCAADLRRALELSASGAAGVPTGAELVEAVYRGDLRRLSGSRGRRAVARAAGVDESYLRRGGLLTPEQLEGAKGSNCPGPLPGKELAADLPLIYTKEATPQLSPYVATPRDSLGGPGLSREGWRLLEAESGGRENLAKLIGVSPRTAARYASGQTTPRGEKRARAFELLEQALRAHGRPELEEDPAEAVAELEEALAVPAGDPLALAAYAARKLQGLPGLGARAQVSAFALASVLRVTPENFADNLEWLLEADPSDTTAGPGPWEVCSGLLPGWLESAPPRTAAELQASVEAQAVTPRLREIAKRSSQRRAGRSGKPWKAGLRCVLLAAALAAAG